MLMLIFMNNTNRAWAKGNSLDEGNDVYLHLICVLNIQIQTLNRQGSAMLLSFLNGCRTDDC